MPAVPPHPRPWAPLAIPSSAPGTCPDPHQESTSGMEEKSLDEAPKIFLKLLSCLRIVSLQDPDA